MSKQEIIFSIESSKGTFFQDYFNAINGSVGLSNKEIIVLAALVEQYNIIRHKTKDDGIINELLFSSRYRTLAREKSNISDLNFNNYISALKKKDVIIEDENKFRSLNPSIVPIIDLSKHNELDLCFSFKIKEDEQAELGRASVSGETSGEGISNDEISPFEFSEIAREEISDTTEHFTILEEEPNDSKLLDGDSTSKGDV